MTKVWNLLLMIPFTVLLLLARLVSAADPAHLVTGLPGQPQVRFKQYAGRITVNSTSERALFYWFYQANHANHSSLPLAIWFNGGPGCSSVGNGALSELGPFRTNDSGTGLVLNKFSWSRAANLIFLESPHGVGFSSSSEHHEFSDEATAADALSFIVKWFKRFPEYLSNDFYLLGESYAGHYIPTLASKILEQNEVAINFKGFAIGNPWTDAYYDNRGDTDFYYSHALISDGTYDGLVQNCDFANDLPVDNDDVNPNCEAAIRDANLDIAKIDYYNIYTASCNTEASSRQRNQFMHREMLTAAYNPCMDSVSPYLNMNEVKEALHVSEVSTRWTYCSGAVVGSYPKADIVNSMLPLYSELLSKGLRILIYSGDVDGIVSTIGTRAWIKKLNLTVETSWYAWDFRNQVGGWTQTYSPNFTYSTVRGAGHMVPADKPEQGLILFEHFLAGKLLPAFQKNQ